MKLGGTTIAASQLNVNVNQMSPLLASEHGVLIGLQ